MQITFFGRGPHGGSHERQVYGISASNPSDLSLFWEGSAAIGNVNGLTLGGPNYQLRVDLTREDVLDCLNSLFKDNPADAQALVAEAQGIAIRRLAAPPQNAQAV